MPKYELQNFYFLMSDLGRLLIVEYKLMKYIIGRDVRGYSYQCSIDGRYSGTGNKQQNLIS